MLSKKMESALNKQINAEIYSAYLYLSMGAWCDAEGLDGFANWFKVQYQEEFAHAMKIYDYIYGRGGSVKMMPIDGPPTSWKSPLDAFDAVCKHEAKVTGLINKLVDQARKEPDHATDNMLQWFVAEQVEEEDTADKIRSRIKMVGGQGHGLHMIDRELAARVFTPPAAKGE